MHILAMLICCLNSEWPISLKGDVSYMPGLAHPKSIGARLEMASFYVPMRVTEPGCSLALCFWNGRWSRLLSGASRLIDNSIKMAMTYLGAVAAVNMVVLLISLWEKSLDGLNGTSAVLARALATVSLWCL